MKCPNCGAEMELDPSSGKVRCPYCETIVTPDAESQEPYGDVPPAAEPLDSSVNTAAEVEMDGDVYEATVYMCRGCGAELLTTEDTAVTFCSYCGSQNILKGRMKQMKSPAFIIPFSKTKAECEEAYRQKLAKSSFVPKNMSSDVIVERFRGIYMPYWIYDLKSEGKVTVPGTKEYRMGDWIHTKIYNLETSGHAKFQGISFDASSSFSDNLSQCIAPYDLEEAKDFDPMYLSGFYSDVADVDADVYSTDAWDMAATYAVNQFVGDPIYSRYRAETELLKANLKLKVTDKKLGLFPVWFLGVRSGDGQRISYGVVNGQTGKVAADLPISFQRYLTGSAILAIPLFLILNMFLTLTPMKALIASIILGIASLVIASGQRNEIFNRENQLDDKGLLASRKFQLSEDLHERSVEARKRVERKKKIRGNLSGYLLFGIIGLTQLQGIIPFEVLVVLGMVLGVLYMVVWIVTTTVKRTANRRDRDVKIKLTFGEKQKYLFKQEIGILVGVLVLFANPASDLFAYGAAAFSMLMILLSFYDLVKGHNQLTTRKLPQMGARGGDEYDFE